MGRYHVYKEDKETWTVKDDRCFSKHLLYTILERDGARRIFAGSINILTVRVIPAQRVVELSGDRINPPIQINWPQTHRGRCQLTIGNETFRCNRSKLTTVRGGKHILIASWDRKFTSLKKVAYLDVYDVADAAIRQAMDTGMILATFIGVQQCMKHVDNVANQTPPVQFQQYEIGGQHVDKYVNAAFEIGRLVRRFYRGP